ncbi:hypothetical protein I6E74_03275 [Salinibacterium sp. SWN139]|uniref:hypothetical protein n=1 Tax=Salinibacterium sp. SWN139 TaxID=2792055 RepID=UPI0018CD14CB|nr:hypothetical protein [Salinibacterium sp. SWN139]MBH0053187.1 hypothetical protein [Salinibacterium sp. SWN139]
MGVRKIAGSVAIAILTPLGKAAIWIAELVQEAKASEAADRLAKEQAALDKSTSEPFVFLEVQSDDDLKHYINRGWELMYYTPEKPKEFVYEKWHLQHDREKLQERLSASS